MIRILAVVILLLSSPAFAGDALLESCKTWIRLSESPYKVVSSKLVKDTSMDDGRRLLVLKVTSDLLNVRRVRDWFCNEPRQTRGLPKATTPETMYFNERLTGK